MLNLNVEVVHFGIDVEIRQIKNSIRMMGKFHKIANPNLIVFSTKMAFCRRPEP